MKNCFNCGGALAIDQSFCSSCGQKIDDNNLTFRAVFNEFIENYLSIDTRIGRTILPFLFQPGQLAKEFISGKRLKYVNPFRFYLFISIAFFFVLGVYIDSSLDKSPVKLNEEALNQPNTSKDAPNQLSDKLILFSEVIDSLESIDSLLVREKMDSLLKAYKLDENVSFTEDSINHKEKQNLVELNTSGLGFNLDANRLKEIKQYAYDDSYTDEALLDSLGASSLGKYERIIALQSIKLYRSDSKNITRFVLGNLSLSLIILIPGFALFLSLFYYRERMPYVAHLIHSLQIHTFCLFLYGLALSLSYASDISIFGWLSFIASAIYMFFSFKKVYPRSFFSTLWRCVLVGLIYYLFWTFVVTTGVLISFLLF